MAISIYLPFWCKVKDLTPMKYHRYTSIIENPVLHVDLGDKSATEEFVNFFAELREKAIKMLTDHSKEQDGSDLHPLQWDNKVVLECKTSSNNIVFIGYKDGRAIIGFGVRSDDWIKPLNIHENKKV